MEIKRFNSEFKDAVKKLEERYSFASVLVQSEKDFSAVSSTNMESITSLPRVEGFCIKAFNGSFFREYSSSVLNKESIDEGVSYLLENYIEGGDLDIDPGDKIVKDFFQECKVDPENIEDSTYLDKATQARNKIEKIDSKIVLVHSVLSYKIKEEVYINRNKELYQYLCRFENVYLVALNDGENVQEIYGGNIRIGGFEHSDLDLDEVRKNVELANKILGASRIEQPGFYDCVLSPSVSGMLAHEAFGHGTETDMFLKNRARGQFYMGKRVASPLVNMWDSADMNHIPDANGSFFFDHEGTIASRTQIMTDGILLSGMTDKYSATKLGINLTSNSRAQSFKNKVYARMTNTFFEPGESDVEDMIKLVKHGYYIGKATNGMEDPKGWGMQIEALYAEEIKDGKLTGKVHSPVILTGYVPDILNSVTHVSSAFEISTLGMCGKGHKEWVKVTEGGPHLKLKARLA